MKESGKKIVKKGMGDKFGLGLIWNSSGNTQVDKERAEEDFARYPPKKSMMNLM